MKENPLTDFELAELANLCKKWWNANGENGTALAESLDYIVFVCEHELELRMFPEPKENEEDLHI